MLIRVMEKLFNLKQRVPRCVAILSRMIKGSFTEKVVFEQRSERREGY